MAFFDLYQYIDGTDGALCVAIRDGGQLAREMRAAIVDGRPAGRLSVRGGTVTVAPGAVIGFYLDGRRLLVEAAPAGGRVVSSAHTLVTLAPVPTTTGRESWRALVDAWARAVAGVRVHITEQEAGDLRPYRLHPDWAALVALDWDDVPVDGEAA